MNSQQYEIIIRNVYTTAQYLQEGSKRIKLLDVGRTVMADIQLDITLEIMERCKHLDCLYITLVDTLLSHTIYQTEMGRRG